MNERPIRFICESQNLIGILSIPDGKVPNTIGVVITVGGPQYRVGSHRQFVTLARSLADNGYHVLRFDYRGMGDSDGDAISFDQAKPDIKAAVDTLLHEVPTINHLILWGLCDAATINLIYTVTDPRISGLVMLNPWIRTQAGQANAELKHYYLKRFTSGKFWGKLISNKVEVRHALTEVVGKLYTSIKSRLFSESRNEFVSLPDQVEACFCSYSGPILLIISGNDLTAAEFTDRVASSKPWQKKIQSSESVELFQLEDADHTFSRQEWKNEVNQITKNWLEGIQKT